MPNIKGCVTRLKDIPYHLVPTRVNPERGGYRVRAYFALVYPLVQELCKCWPETALLRQFYDGWLAESAGDKGCLHLVAEPVHARCSFGVRTVGWSCHVVAAILVEILHFVNGIQPLTSSSLGSSSRMRSTAFASDPECWEQTLNARLLFVEIRISLCLAMY